VSEGQLRRRLAAAAPCEPAVVPWKPCRRTLDPNEALARPTIG